MFDRGIPKSIRREVLTMEEVEIHKGRLTLGAQKLPLASAQGKGTREVVGLWLDCKALCSPKSLCLLARADF